MSTTFAPQSATAPVQAVSADKPVKRWLVGPWFDLFFLANLAWPIAALLALSLPLDGASPLGFFQIYLLSTPHRWITLVLVFCDSERFWKEPAKFGGLGVGLILFGLVLVGVAGFVPYAAGSLMLLMMLDYVWNAWHFASQHAGISRIYGRMSRQEQSLGHAEFEKMAVRTLVLWVFVRFAIHLGAGSIYSGNVEWMTPWLYWIDPFVFLPVVVLVAREIAAFRPQAAGRLVYIVSVIALYSAQLVAIRLENRGAMTALFFAGAIFHAVEYLAICNWSVQKRTTGIWRYQITRTGLALFAFMAILGIVNYFVSVQSLYAWQLITLLVSLLHYGYDGIIWKGPPRPAAAK